MNTRLLLPTLLLFLLLASACNAGAVTAPPDILSTAARPQAETTDNLRNVTLGLGFIPNVQFAPFYVAQKKGFYAEEGLSVEIEHGFENDFITLAAQGERDFAVGSGDQVILARAQGLPITYVMKWYQRYPVALLLGPEQSVTQPAELDNVKVGIPGLYGASFVGWKALVYGAGINEAAVDVQEIGFTQAAAVQQQTVDGAVVYIANEPIQLRNQGVNVTIFEVSDYINLVSNGLIVGDELMKQEPELVQKMVQASLRGLEYTINNPDEAFEISREIITEMTDKDAVVQQQVLAASIDLWRTDRPGYSDPDAWHESVEFMQAAGLLNSADSIDVETFFTNDFVEGQ
jgi:NitT/TauT family transport system substrate-binding protein